MYAQRNIEVRSCNRCCSGLHIASVYSLSYPTCNAHAPHCHLQTARFYKIFPNYLINAPIFEKKVTERKMCVSIFSKNCF